MSEKCNGANIVQENTNTAGQGFERRSANEGGKKESFPLDPGFRGFIRVPQVRLERHDIIPYLNGFKRSVLRGKILKTRHKDEDVHKSRLAQKCLVKLMRDDLEKLKASFHYRPLTPVSKDSIDSDTESFNSTDMVVTCKICDKSYNSEKKLLNHQQNKHIIYKSDNGKPQKRVSFSDHVIIHEVKEYHKCRKCTKIFEDYQSLKQHMKKIHKKRKCYICNYCDKSFADRMFFKVHVRLHCDRCGALFPNKKTHMEHRRDVCRVVKLYKCKTCDESFFKIMNLKDHSYDHLDTVIYVCDICKDQFQSKCAIAHHVSFLHSKRRSRPKELYTMLKVGTERLYLCLFCDESSVERDVLEKHVQKLPDLTNKAMTGYKDYYFCDQCMKKFDTEQDMLQHKWTHFLKTSDNSQTRPKSILTKRNEIKSIYKVTEEIPECMRPFVILEKVDEIYPLKYADTVNIKNHIIASGNDITILKKALVDPKSKKTLLSRHQCQTCDRYFSSNYCLNRHISTQHADFENLRCKICEEIFVWPSLLLSHKCIRLHHPEMPFDDARPEIQFENLHESQNFDDLNIDENDDYMNTVDFEIPAPIVELRECDSTFMGVDGNEITQVGQETQFSQVSQNVCPSLGYKIVMQEVPIEF